MANTSGITVATGISAGAGSAGGGAVTQLLAGTGISLSPAGGTGAVTITATGGGGGDTITSPGATLLIGGTATATTLDINPALAFTKTAVDTYSIALAANTAGDGLVLINSNTASAANQMDSPAAHLTGKGWATTPVTSQAVDSRMYVRPVQGAANPTGFLVVDYSVNGAAFADMLTIPLVANGTAVLLGSLTVNGLRVQGASIPTNGLYLPGTNQLGISTNGVLRATVEATGQLRLVVVGVGYSTAEGTNAKQGVATLAAGTVVVANTSVTASSRIFLTAQSLGTVTSFSTYGISARTAGTSFTILASQGTDTSVIAYEIFEPS